jgi:hypothetical protein
MMNPYTHLYLYARGWYEQSENVIDDLKIICGNYSAIFPQYVTRTDIMHHLTHLALFEINRSGNPQYHFLQFVKATEERGAISACLNALRFVEVDGLNLGNPDYTILPKRSLE